MPYERPGDSRSRTWARSGVSICRRRHGGSAIRDFHSWFRLFPGGKPRTFARTVGGSAKRIGTAHLSPALMSKVGDAGPLSGVRVIDISQGLSGPLASLLLAQEGAEVIKVEPPCGDYLRLWGGSTDRDGDCLFEAINANKYGITLDLTNPTDITKLYELLSTADILISDLSSSIEHEYGLSYNKVHKLCPNLIYASTRYCDIDELLPEDLGSELVVQALSESSCAGLGEQGARPCAMEQMLLRPSMLWRFAGGIIAALLARSHQGIGGQRLDVDQFTTLLVARGSAYASRTDPDQWIGLGSPFIQSSRIWMEGSR